MNQKEMNDFTRKYFDKGFKYTKNIINHDSNTTTEHKRLVNEICLWLSNNKVDFYTRVFLKGGEIVDIVAPGLPRPFIEVRCSELGKQKEYLKEYDGLRIYVDDTDPFRLL